MADLADDDFLTLDAKTDPVIAGPQALPAGQIAGEGFGAAHVWPSRQATKQLPHTFLDGRRKRVEMYCASGVNTTSAMP